MPGAKKPAVVVALAAALSVSACTSVKSIRYQSDEAPVLEGPSARDNHTPLDAAYACMSDRLSGSATIGIGVGDVKDYTGKYSDDEGNAITQGGALMVISALGKLGPSVRIHERFDTRIAELELVYMEKRQLGDGRMHGVDGKPVPWKPYYGGSIRDSDYYIVGGITELNFNIQSGGAEAYVMQIGPKARTYTMNVAADLRIVDSKSLVVVETASLQKQITGYEVGVGVFNFFGNTLVDVNVGAKNQEPLQLGVRTVLELGVLELVSSVTGVPYEPCLAPFDTVTVAEAAAAPLDKEPAPVASAPVSAGATKAAAPAAKVKDSIAAATEPPGAAAIVVPLPRPRSPPTAQPVEQPVNGSNDPLGILSPTN